MSHFPSLEAGAVVGAALFICLDAPDIATAYLEFQEFVVNLVTALESAELDSQIAAEQDRAERLARELAAEQARAEWLARERARLESGDGQ